MESELTGLLEMIRSVKVSEEFQPTSVAPKELRTKGKKAQEAEWPIGKPGRSGLDVLLDQHQQRLSGYIEREPESKVRFIFDHYSITLHPSSFLVLKAGESFLLRSVLWSSASSACSFSVCILFLSCGSFVLVHNHASASLSTLRPSLAPDSSLPLTNSLHLLL